MQPTRSKDLRQDPLCSLTEAVRELVQIKQKEFEWSKSHHGFATKQDLEQVKDIIMSAISDFAAKQNAHNARLDAAVSGLEGDVEALNAEIVKLQNTQGAITPEDQALLDDIEARSAAIATKLEALDALTPPVVPAG